MSVQNQAVLQCLPLLASVLGNQYGVEVRMSGQNAYCVGKIINLPALPDTDDEKLLPLARGFIDHESGHIRFTDIEAVSRANLDAVTKNIFNSVEDWRIEQKMAEMYPGCREHFQWLISNFCFQEADPMAGKPPAISVMKYVLASVRQWDVPEIEQLRSDYRQQMEVRYPGLASQVDAILNRIRADCPSTQAAIDYAREITACIKQWQPPVEAPDQNSQQDNKSEDSKSKESDCPRHEAKNPKSQNLDEN